MTYFLVLPIFQPIYLNIYIYRNYTWWNLPHFNKHGRRGRHGNMSSSESDFLRNLVMIDSLISQIYVFIITTVHHPDPQLSFFSPVTPCKNCSPVARKGRVHPQKVFGLAARVGCGPLDSRKTGRRFPTPTKPVEISLTKQGDYMFNKASHGAAGFDRMDCEDFCPFI